MRETGIISQVNTNPMAFEELAASLANLFSYARDGDMNMKAPFNELEHLYQHALQEPPGYSEITSLTGHGLKATDRQRGRAAWLLMNTEGLKVYGVHSRVWHKVGGKYSAPILKQVSHAIEKECALTDEKMQKLGVEQAIVDVLGVKDDAIWLVEVISNDRVVDSALKRVGNDSKNLFPSVVYEDQVVDGDSLTSLYAVTKQMQLAFPATNITTLVLLLHRSQPDFELYEVKLPKRKPLQIKLQEGMISSNSINYSDALNDDPDILFKLPEVLDNDLFQGIPPCRGGRTLGMLASAAKRQLESESLLTWKQRDFICVLQQDYGYHIERDKVRHDLEDRLVIQGFFRKWGSDYYVSMKGIARYLYCLAKFTNKGQQKFELDQCIRQRDRIMKRFGCLG